MGANSFVVLWNDAELLNTVLCIRISPYLISQLRWYGVAIIVGGGTYHENSVRNSAVAAP